jgi:hypothetical protein
MKIVPSKGKNCNVSLDRLYGKNRDIYLDINWLAEYTPKYRQGTSGLLCFNFKVKIGM